MTRGRPPKGPARVDHLDGSPEANRRLRVILETIAGEKGIARAAAELGVGESRFHELRNEVLQQALASLEPRPRGRPARERSAEGERIVELEEEVLDLATELRTAQIREEIAVLMPHVLRPVPARVRPRPQAPDAVGCEIDPEKSDALEAEVKKNSAPPAGSIEPASPAPAKPREKGGKDR